MKPHLLSTWVLCLVALSSRFVLAEPPRLVSRAALPSATASGDSAAPVISKDGGHAVFLSTAGNLVTNDTNGGLMDVFVRDLTSGVTQLISVGTNGESGNGPCFSASISSNGQFVVFASRAGNLVAGDTNNVADIFLRDCLAGTTHLVSAATNGYSGDGESGSPEITPDGRFVWFESRAADLVSGDTNRVQDVFGYDRLDGSITCLSAASTSPQLGTRPAGESLRGSLSDDGATAVFVSYGLNLAPGISSGGYTHTNRLYYLRPPASTNQMVDLFPPDLNAATIVDALAYRLSSDGRYLALQASSSRPATLSNGVYWVDLDTGTSLRVATNLNTAFLSKQLELSGPAISDDGETVVFEAREPGNLAGTTIPVVYSWNATSREISRVSSGGWIADTNQEPPLVTEAPRGEFLAASADTEFVAFLGGDTNDPPAATSASQLMVRRRSTGELRRVSRTVAGVLADPVDFPAVSFSGDGHRLVFQSTSPDLVPDDRNAGSDVFLYDWDHDTVELVSRRHDSLASSSPAAHSWVGPCSLSADGRSLVFLSADPSLAEGDTNGAPDVFVLDLETGTNQVVSANLAGAGTANAGAREPVISADGRWVAFTSTASDLVANDTNRVEDVFLRDCTLGTTLLVSRNASGTSSANRASSKPAISSDGRFVAFVSTATDLVSLDTDTNPDIYFFDRVQATVTLVTTNHAGVASAGGISLAPVFSPDDAWILFGSSATDLTNPTLTSGWRAYAWERATGAIRVLSVDGPFSATTTTVPSVWQAPVPIACSGDSHLVVFPRRTTTTPAADELAVHDLQSGESATLASPARDPSASSDGRYVAYRSFPSGPGTRQVLVADRQTGTTILASVSAGTTNASNGFACPPVLSGDGRFVVFASGATDLVAGDTNNVADICVRDLQSDTTLVLSATARGTPGNRLSASPVLAADGRTVVFASFATDLDAADFNPNQDLFLVRLPGPESEFRILTITRPGSGVTTLVWAAPEGTTQVLQYKNDLAEADWHPLDVPITIEGGQGTATDDTTAGVPHRFYRVVQSP